MSLHHISESKTTKLLLLHPIFLGEVEVREFQVLMLIEGHIFSATFGLEL